MRVLAALAVALVACSASAAPSASENKQSGLIVFGDVTVIGFWATTCAPCRKELPMLEALRAAVAADPRVRVVGVSVDDPRDAARARALARKLGLTMPIVVDAHAYASLFGGGDLAVPRLAVIDRKRAGLQRLGARADEARDTFVREVTAAIASVEAGAPAAPTPMWQPLRPQ